MERLDLQRSSVSFTLRGPKGELGPVHIGVPGLHNARNGATAIVAALQVGVPSRRPRLRWPVSPG